MFAAGGGSTPDNGKTYIEDVFSTYLYTGNGSTQSINNGIQLGDGTVNGTTLHLTGDALTDSSGYSHTITKVGTISVSTSQKKYGTGSLASTSGSNCLYTSSTIAGNLDSADFTIEFWIYFNSWVPYNHALSGHTSDGDSNKPWTFFTLNSDWAFYASSPASPTGWDIVSGLSLGSTFTNQWKHIAITRSGNTFRSFVNGVQQATATSSLAMTSSNGVSVFSTLTRTEALNGYIDDLRITKGKALYTTNFTPPTAALPLDTFATGKGGMVWQKDRAAYNHKICDTASGVGFIESNTTAAKNSNGNVVSSFNSDGFTTSNGYWGTGNIVSWTFRKTPKFFDVVTYTGDDVVGRKISHSLGIEPGMIIAKATSTTGSWCVWNRGNGISTSTGGLSLNTTSAAYLGTNVNASSYISSSDFSPTIVSDFNGTSANTNGVTYVAYLFAHDTSTDGLIQCGSFTGVPAIVNLGWEPQLVLIKKSSSGGGDQNWRIYDNMRGMSHSTMRELQPNTSNAEVNNDDTNICVPNSTGFTVTNLDSAATYIYMAIRRGPMRTPTDGTKVFKPLAVTGAPGTIRTIGFPSDVIYGKYRASYDAMFTDRMRGFLNANTMSSPSLYPYTTAAEAYPYPLAYNVWNTTAVDGGYMNNVDAVFYHFRRAPGFFDVVCYTGDGNYRTINHNLGVTPELVITKRRTNITSSYQGWIVTGTVLGMYTASSPSMIYMNESNPINTRGGSPVDSLITYFTGNFGNNSFSPTYFAVGNGGETNAIGEKHIAYLFASCPGVSKIGIYTGNGSSQAINCGFANGARFVLIKRTDSTGDWYVWDTARGIVSNNDPHLSFNTTVAEVTTDDSIDPDSTGFIVNHVAPTYINENSASYLYLAIA